MSQPIECHWLNSTEYSTYPKPAKWLSFARINLHVLQIEASVTGGKRVTAMSILGVMIDERLSVTGHVDKILGSCASSMHALNVLRERGMPTTLLHEVTRATMVARLLYASPSWFGFLKAADLHRLE